MTEDERAQVVSLCPTSADLRRAAEALTILRYRLVWLDATGWNDEEDLFRALAGSVPFPDYFGNNWDALDEVLRDINDGEIDLPSDAAGLAVAIDCGDRLRAVSARAPGFLVAAFLDAVRTSPLGEPRLSLLMQVSGKHGAALHASRADAGWR